MASNLLARFVGDRRGNYALMTVIATVPIMGGLAVAVDFAEMSRQRQATLNALDAAGIATAQRFRMGGDEAEIRTYAQQFFEANLGPVDPSKASLRVVLPKAEVGEDTVKLYADLEYDPYFLPAFQTLLADLGGKETPESGTPIDFSAFSEVKLKNAVEVALVLDNSGSMDDPGSGSGDKRIDILKEAAKELVATMVAEAEGLKQVDKPVQFGIVPFAGSVNVGPDNADAAWMDATGISPIHHENFDWQGSMSSSYDTQKYAEKIGDIWYARGDKWGTHKNKPLTRFAIYDLMKRVTDEDDVCVRWNTRRTRCLEWGKEYEYGPVAAWGGCVEARPHPYNVTDDPASTATPATMFVPMFGPDETDNRDGSDRPANNNWRKDITSSGDNAKRQAYMPKYFLDLDRDTDAYGTGEGPNASCTTQPITPLKDVTETEGHDAIKAAIEAMTPLGATNVPEGIAWGWRVVSGRAPFTEGRPESENGVDKVVIVLTDGANTYYTPGSVQAESYSGGDYWEGGNDLAGSKAIYSAYGYMKPFSSPYTDGRLYQGVSTAISKSTFENQEYGDALNEQMASACTNAKADGIIIVTVALDLSTSKESERKQIEGLKACASESRFRRDPADPTKGAKLFWNATGATLKDAFKDIADELSNLRIVG